jgi:hypothetical protein
MRLDEFASAEEQLALWKLISDNTWQAIRQQVEAERVESAARAAQTKLKPKRTGGKRGGRKSLPPPPRFTPPPPPKKPAPPTDKTEVPAKAAQQNGWGTKQPQANAATPIAASPLAAQAHKLPQANAANAHAMPKPNPLAAQANKPQQASATHPIQPHPQAAQQPLTPQQMQLKRQNAGVLAKNSAVAKRM